jgi:hypothetical protein
LFPDGHLGLELKWEGGLAGLRKQLKKERLCLCLIASYYNCPYISLAAILPRQQKLDEVDAVIALADVSEFLDRLSAEHPDEWYLKRASEEFLVTRRVQPTASRIDQDLWQIKSLEEMLSLAAGQDSPTAANKWVGYIDGMDDLRGRTAVQLRQRPHWKIADSRLSKNWYPLSAIATAVREALAQETHSRSPALQGSETGSVQWTAR